MYDYFSVLNPSAHACTFPTDIMSHGNQERISRINIWGLKGIVKSFHQVEKWRESILSRHSFEWL